VPANAAISDFDENLSRPRLRSANITKNEDLGAAELLDKHRFHHSHPAPAFACELNALAAFLLVQ
jgi:hypothetical protein